MVRYDLRNYKDNFYDKLKEILTQMKTGDVSIFLFEVGDFTSVQKSADVVHEMECALLNSLKFNEVDWTIVVKKEANR